MDTKEFWFKYPNSSECATCGDRFGCKRKGAKYCSPACKQKAYRWKKMDAELEHPLPKTIPCEHCNEPYPYRYQSRFCSGRCRTVNYRQRQAYYKSVGEI